MRIKLILSVAFENMRNPCEREERGKNSANNSHTVECYGEGKFDDCNVVGEHRGIPVLVGEEVGAVHCKLPWLILPNVVSSHHHLHEGRSVKLD